MFVFRFAFLAVAVLLCAITSPSQAEATPFYADEPESWLVLYNLNSADSITWAHWYAQQRQIPASNLLGLNASTTEHLVTHAQAEAEIFGPVREFLTHPYWTPVTRKIMGIIVGYGVPGTYHRYAGGGNPANYGGYSIASGLANLFNDYVDGELIIPEWQPNPFNPDVVINPSLITSQPAVALVSGLRATRLSKDQMGAGIYMTARIDAPNLSIAQALTTRAQAISTCTHRIDTELAYWDAYAPALNKTHFWFWLMVNNNTGPLAPWYNDQIPHDFWVPATWFNFDSENAPATPNAAFRFDTYKLLGWSAPEVWPQTNAGSRILAYEHNSYGLVTARETMTLNAQAPDGKDFFGPNAISNGWAAVIGSTAEPQWEPRLVNTKVIMASLKNKWNVGEAFHLSNYRLDFHWTLLGDPFLRVPNWFGETGDQCIDLPKLIQSHSISPLEISFQVSTESRPCTGHRWNWQSAFTMEGNNIHTRLENIRRVANTIKATWKYQPQARCEDWTLKLEVCDQAGNRTYLRRTFVADPARGPTAGWTPTCLDHAYHDG